MVYPEINLQSGVPIYLQLKASFRRMAALGLIKAHDQLPSVRQLASELGINPNTVQKAYGEMEQENLIYAVPGKGNYLSDIPENKELEKEEIRRIFRSATHLAWLAGISSEELHRLLDGTIEEELKAKGKKGELDHGIGN
ncbi:MAG TPA: GntR family transcriptional regulator [Bacillota bacterium]|jgi:GntR family transcriptional regulator|nr:GntR family transcriptional regulator [Fastidiosipila sp.]HPX93064.1 GntR family transcriptional regulator [Bacillota bacterium]HQB80863.1 GntR family transcriptional regulator [Bacillota bacterium]